MPALLYPTHLYSRRDIRMSQAQSDGLLEAEEILALQQALGSMVGLDDAHMREQVEGLSAAQRVMLLAAKGLTAFDDRLSFASLHTMAGRSLWAIGKLIYTIADVRMRGKEDQIHTLTAEYGVYGVVKSTGARENWREFFMDAQMRADVCFHLVSLWGLNIQYWNPGASRIRTPKAVSRDRLTRVQRQVLAFAESLAGTYDEDPKLTDVRRMPPAFQQALGSLLMTAGMHRVSDDREVINFWIRWTKGESIERDRMMTMTPGVGQPGASPTLPESREAT